MAICSDGMGGRDLWKVEKGGNEWGAPVNLTSHNTEYDEGYPFVSHDAKELWFTGDSRIDVNPPMGQPITLGPFSVRQEKVICGVRHWKWFHS